MGTLGAAGCLGNGDTSGSGDGDSDGDGSGGESVRDHPAAAGLSDLPRRGDLGGHVVLTFEDPSCSRCRAFARDTVPEIEETLVATGQAAYVVRTYPVVYPWGEPASLALEATFARDAEGFWALLDWYFENQSSFSTDDVLDRTRSFLDGDTDIDGAAVVSDVEAGTAEAAVEANLDAGRNADLGEITPIVLLFRDGEYVTTATGSVSYDVVATALGEA